MQDRVVNGVEESVERLMEAVKQSDVYIRYQTIQETIHRLPELEKEINEFRNRTYRMQNSNGAIDIYDETDRMEERYREWRRNPLVSEYLAAECAMCRMMQQINWKMIEELDFDAGLDE